MTGATLTGDAELEQAFKELPDRVQRKHLRHGVRRAGSVIGRAAKAHAPRETGLLARSIGQRAFTHRDKKGIGTRIGPRKGFGRMVRVNKRGDLKALSKGKMAEAQAAGEQLEYRDPAKYAHIVELGRRGGKPFLTPALEESKGAALATIAASVREGIDTEAPKFMPKGK